MLLRDNDKKPYQKHNLLVGDNEAEADAYYIFYVLIEFIYLENAELYEYSYLVKLHLKSPIDVPCLLLA